MTVSERAEAWRRRGSTFRWAPRDGSAPETNVFHVESGPVDGPVLLLVHGFPTSSIDWFEVADLLDDDFRVGLLDFPGYGFSDKPRGWGYRLTRDAELLEYYAREVLGASRVTLVAHDRGSSVALALVLGGPAPSGDAPLVVEHLVLTNANIFLPLSQLTDFQRLVLDPATAPEVLDVVTPELLAAGMGTTTFSPPRPADHPDVAALAVTFAHDDGVGVLHETIQYLVERAEHERDWLEGLATREVATTLIWGLLDTVSPPRVAAAVWNEFVAEKPGRNRLYLVPGANHYLQVDRPSALVDAVRHALAGSADAMAGPIASGPDAPVLVDASRTRLPAATEVLGRGSSRRGPGAAPRRATELGGR